MNLCSAFYSHAFGKKRTWLSCSYSWLFLPSFSSLNKNLFCLSVQYTHLYFHDLLLKHFNSPIYLLKTQFLFLGTFSLPGNVLLSMLCVLEDATWPGPGPILWVQFKLKNVRPRVQNLLRLLRALTTGRTTKQTENPWCQPHTWLLALSSLYSFQ